LQVTNNIRRPASRKWQRQRLHHRPGPARDSALIKPIRLLAVAAFALAAAGAAFAGLAFARSGGLVIDGHSVKNVRDARYCELIPIVREGFHIRATVYNTLGLNDCPEAAWSAITEEAMQRRFGALSVLLNGPRHFVMDSITALGATAAGKKIEAGGIKLAERATIALGPLDLMHRPYREITVNVDARYVFKAEQPVFVLQAPDGSRYVMQSYAQTIDKSLSYADLSALGERLALPSGWRYREQFLEKDLTLGGKGKAVILQDELENSYQKAD
jgi:hypothetical protein